MTLTKIQQIPASEALALPVRHPLPVGESNGASVGVLSPESGDSAGSATLEVDEMTGAACYELSSWALELIEVGVSPIHGRGIFARTSIPEDTHVGDYDGPMTFEDGCYVLWCYDEQDRQFGIEGRNELRYCNHSPEPNAIFLGEELWTLREIEEGEEITFHYGEDWQGA